MKRIMDLPTETELTANDYGIISNSEDGDRKILASTLNGGGAGSVDWYMNGDKVAQASPAQYIDTPLLKTLTAGKYVVTLNDNGSYFSTTFIYSGGTLLLSSILSNNRQGNFNGTLKITSSTAGLSTYGGNYRDIYCKISKLDDSQMYS